MRAFLTMEDCIDFQDKLKRLGYPVSRARVNLLKSLMGADLIELYNFGSDSENIHMSNMPTLIANIVLEYAGEKKMLAGAWSNLKKYGGVKGNLKSAKDALKVKYREQIKEILDKQSA